MKGARIQVRLVACAISVACMLVDDLPEAGYNTFHDPATAAMLSVIFANGLALAWRRGWRLGIFLLMVPMLISKGMIQSLFWIHNAWVWLMGRLLVAHGVLGYLATGKAVLRHRLDSGGAAVLGVGLATIPIFALLEDHSWISSYVAFGAARILIPFAFWMAVIRVEKVLVEQGGGCSDSAVRKQ